MVLTASCSSSGCPIDSLTARPARVHIARSRFYGAGQTLQARVSRLQLALAGLCAYWNPPAWRPSTRSSSPASASCSVPVCIRLAFSGAVTLALFVALVVALLIRHNDLPAARPSSRSRWPGCAVALVGALPSALRWRNTTLAVTDRRIWSTAGSLRRRDLAVPLAPAAVDQDTGLTGGVLDHGTVTVIAAPDGSTSSFGHVARARELVEVARAPGPAQRRRRGAAPG